MYFFVPKNTSKMDYQCIVVYTIVRIAPFYPNTSVTNGKPGCLDWIKSQIKRFELFFSHFVFIDSLYIVLHDLKWKIYGMEIKSYHIWMLLKVFMNHSLLHAKTPFRSNWVFSFRFINFHTHSRQLVYWILFLNVFIIYFIDSCFCYRLTDFWIGTGMEFDKYWKITIGST